MKVEQDSWHRCKTFLNLDGRRALLRPHMACRPEAIPSPFDGPVASRLPAQCQVARARAYCWAVEKDHLFRRCSLPRSDVGSRAVPVCFRYEFVSAIPNVSNTMCSGARCPIHLSVTQQGSCNNEDEPYTATTHVVVSTGMTKYALLLIRTPMQPFR